MGAAAAGAVVVALGVVSTDVMVGVAVLAALLAVPDVAPALVPAGVDAGPEVQAARRTTTGRASRGRVRRRREGMGARL
ncbi:hypothetical protein GCM10009817_20250 [Terrabacter lapilli]|uniref:Uncharacterized protein n=1 Tax=Terrabacter lapilli TaxID=436231 RepID=A0ABN2S3C7_9MICO